MIAARKCVPPRSATKTSSFFVLFCTTISISGQLVSCLILTWLQQAHTQLIGYAKRLNGFRSFFHFTDTSLKRGVNKKSRFLLPISLFCTCPFCRNRRLTVGR